MFRLGKFLDIEVSLHWTLLLLVLWTASSGPLPGFLASIAFYVAMFACVLFHEFGHALAARQFGIRTPHITLYPIGGVATLDRMPRDPKQELWIAIAGPLVNVVIAALLWISIPPLTLILGPGVAGWVFYLMLANIVLVVFNLLPAFPMDGGRVFRAICALFMSYTDATRLAASVGKVLAVGFAVIGIVYGPFMLTLVAAFVYLAGSTEANAVAHDGRPAWRPPAAPAGLRSPWIRAVRDGQVVTAIWDDERCAYRIVPDAYSV